QRMQDRRDSILAAARQAFARSGFEGTSIADIARAAGVSDGLVYRYFANKRDLLNAVLTAFYERTMVDLEAIAARRGITADEVALEHMLSGGGRGMLYHPFLNYANGSLDPSFAMLSHRDTVPGLSDGGAHVGMICDGSFPTSNLTHWTRDRTRGPKFSFEQVVKMQTRDTAETVGLLDRGLVAVGLRADLNVIDYDRLTLHAPGV
ncbi:MAG: amidohydrolase family protein, partial [Hyphomonas sp.]